MEVSPKDVKKRGGLSRITKDPDRGCWLVLPRVSCFMWVNVDATASKSLRPTGMRDPLPQYVPGLNPGGGPGNRR